MFGPVARMTDSRDDDLFRARGAAEQAGSAPLAARMRPRTLDEFVGQGHIVGPGRLLRRAIQADQLSSLIFYGPPGTGKTTLAQVIAGTTRARFTALNAVLAGVKQLREAIQAAREARDLHGQRTILFVDEVHRWNKAQQDALLPSVENGTIVLIGATTENPYFEVIKPLVSRSRIFQLQALTRDDLERVARAALADAERGLGRVSVRGCRGCHGAPAERRQWRCAQPAQRPGAGGHHDPAGRRRAWCAWTGRWPRSRSSAARCCTTRKAMPTTTPSAPSSRACAAPTRTPPFTGWRAWSTPARIHATCSGAC